MQYVINLLGLRFASQFYLN